MQKQRENKYHSKDAEIRSQVLLHCGKFQLDNCLHTSSIKTSSIHENSVNLFQHTIVVEQKIAIGEMK